MRSLLALAVAFAVLGCGAKTEKKIETYMGDGYSIDPPAGWKHEPISMGRVSGDSFELTTRDEAEGGTSLAIIKEALPGAMTSAEYADKALPLLSTVLPGYRFVERQDVKIGDLQAVKVVVEHRIGESEVDLIQYLIVHDQTAWTIGCTASKANAEEDMPLCEQAAKTFKPSN